MHNLQEIYGLIEIKKRKLSEILQITKNTRLTATNESINDYVNLIYSRKILFESINQIETELKTLNFIFINKNQDNLISGGNKIHEIVLETQKIVSEIIKIDDKNILFVNCIMDDIKKNLKDFSQKRSLYTCYQKNLYLYGRYFDKKK